MTGASRKRAPVAGAPKGKPGRPRGKRKPLWHSRNRYWFYKDGHGRQRSLETADYDEAERRLAEIVLGKVDPGLIKLGPLLFETLAEGCPLSTFTPVYAFWNDLTVGHLDGRAHDYYAFRKTESEATGRVISDETIRLELKFVYALGREAGEAVDPNFRILGWLPGNGGLREGFMFADEFDRFVRIAFGFVPDETSADGWQHDCEERFVLRDEATRSRWRPLVRFLLLGAYTSSRRGVLLSATWTPDPEHGHVDLDVGLLYREGDGETHDNKRGPPVRLLPRLCRLLRRWRALDRRHGWTRVVHNGKGRGLHLYKIWGEVAAAAGLEAFTPHALRATCATWLLAAGLDEQLVADFLGITVPVLLMHYAQAHSRFTEGVADALDTFARLGSKEVSLAEVAAERREKVLAAASRRPRPRGKATIPIPT